MLVTGPPGPARPVPAALRSAGVCDAERKMDYARRTVLKTLCKDISLFHQLPVGLDDAILNIAQLRVYRCGEEVFDRNDKMRSMYIVLQGSVGLFVESSVQKEGIKQASRTEANRVPKQCAALLQAGDSFGSNALFENAARAYHAIAVEDCELAELRHDQYIQVMGNYEMWLRMKQRLAGAATQGGRCRSWALMTEDQKEDVRQSLLAPPHLRTDVELDRLYSMALCSPWFYRLETSPEIERQFTRQLRLLQLGPGEALYVQGDETPARHSCMYLLVKGTLSVHFSQSRADDIAQRLRKAQAVVPETQRLYQHRFSVVSDALLPGAALSPPATPGSVSPASNYGAGKPPALERLESSAGGAGGHEPPSHLRRASVTSDGSGFLDPKGQPTSEDAGSPRSDVLEASIAHATMSTRRPAPLPRPATVQAMGSCLELLVPGQLVGQAEIQVTEYDAQQQDGSSNGSRIVQRHKSVVARERCEVLCIPHTAYLTLLREESALRLQRGYAKLRQMAGQRAERRSLGDIEAAMQAVMHLKFFAAQDRDTVRTLCRLLGYHKYGEGEMVCRQGAPGSHFYIILTGEVSIHVLPKQQKTTDNVQRAQLPTQRMPWESEQAHSRGARQSSEGESGGLHGRGQSSSRSRRYDVDALSTDADFGRCVVKLGPGNSFGEKSVIENSPLSATVLCQRDTELLSIPAEDYLRVFGRRNLNMITGVSSVIALLRKPAYQRTQQDVDMLTDRLKSVAFFHDMPLTVRKFAAYNFKYEVLGPDTVLYEEGDRSEHLFIVLKGSVSLHKRNRRDLVATAAAAASAATSSTVAGGASRSVALSADTKPNRQRPRALARRDDGKTGFPAAEGEAASGGKALPDGGGGVSGDARSLFQSQGQPQWQAGVLQEDKRGSGGSGGTRELHKRNSTSLRSPAQRSSLQGQHPLTLRSSFVGDVRQLLRASTNAGKGQPAPSAAKGAGTTPSVENAAGSGSARGEGDSEQLELLQRQLLFDREATDIQVVGSGQGQQHQQPHQQASAAAVDEDFEEDIEQMYGPRMQLAGAGVTLGDVTLMQNLRRDRTAITRETTHFITLSKINYMRTIRRTKKVGQGKQDEWADFLKTLAPFRSWTRIELLRLAFYLEEKRLKRGEVLFEQGGPAGDVFVVRSGMCKAVFAAQVASAVPEGYAEKEARLAGNTGAQHDDGEEEDSENAQSADAVQRLEQLDAQYPHRILPQRPRRSTALVITPLIHTASSARLNGSCTLAWQGAAEAQFEQQCGLPGQDGRPPKMAVLDMPAPPDAVLRIELALMSMGEICGLEGLARQPRSCTCTAASDEMTVLVFKRRLFYTSQMTNTSIEKLKGLHLERSLAHRRRIHEALTFHHTQDERAAQAQFDVAVALREQQQLEAVRHHADAQILHALKARSADVVSNPGAVEEEEEQEEEHPEEEEVDLLAAAEINRQPQQGRLASRPGTANAAPTARSSRNGTASPQQRESARNLQVAPTAAARHKAMRAPATRAASYSQLPSVTRQTESKWSKTAIALESTVPKRERSQPGALALLRKARDAQTPSQSRALRKAYEAIYEHLREGNGKTAARGIHSTLKAAP